MNFTGSTVEGDRPGLGIEINSASPYTIVLPRPRTIIDCLINGIEIFYFSLNLCRAESISAARRFSAGNAVRYSRTRTLFGKLSVA